MRAERWTCASLGPPSEWPQSLRTVVNLVLGSTFPMFVAWGPQLCQIYNDAYIELLGDKHPKSLGNPLYEVWSEIRADLEPLVIRALQGDSPYHENLPLRMRRGPDRDEEAWFTFSYSPVQDEQGAIAGIFCAVIETTKTVLAERALRAEQARLHSFFQQAPGFAAVLRGPHHVFETVNDAYLQLIGMRDPIGKPVHEVLPEMLEQGFIALLDSVYERGKPFVGNSVRVLLNRSPASPPVEAFVDFVYQPVFAPDGSVEGIFVQGHEVTEQHLAQRALRDADRQKDEFLATLAHELRNPLAPIRTAAQLLAQPKADNAAKQRAVDVITRQVGHMSHLLDDLIDIARITQRRLSLKHDRLRVGDVIGAAIEAARPLADARGHELAVKVAEPDAMIVGDAVRITQVLSNLLNNACKYTDSGGRVQLEVQSQDRWLVFTVTDNGIGLNAESIDKLFDMFAQEQSALDRSEGGLGIGLALAKGLVTLHGGSIAAHSEGPGRGSRFIVKLPLGETINRPRDGTEVVVPPSVAAKCRVLLADDNQDAVSLLADVLRLDDHEVHTVHDGIEAAALALKLRPDVVVLDIGMPGLNGYEVARRIRALPWGSKPLLIASTGWGQEDDRLKATAAGFDKHLTKPFDPQHLCDLIARHTP